MKILSQVANIPKVLMDEVRKNLNTLSTRDLQKLVAVLMGKDVSFAQAWTEGDPNSEIVEKMLGYAVHDKDFWVQAAKDIYNKKQQEYEVAWGKNKENIGILIDEIETFLINMGESGAVGGGTTEKEVAASTRLRTMSRRLRIAALLN